MERITPDIQRGHFFVANLDPLRVNLRIKFASHRQASLGRGGGDQFHYRQPAGQRGATPGLRDVAEQPVLILFHFDVPGG
jgi:hypothetical protein